MPTPRNWWEKSEQDGDSNVVNESFPDNAAIIFILKNRNYFNIIRAKKGEMFVTEDDRYFIMQLNDGDQYQKMEKRSVNDTYPFIRTKFREWIKVFDLGEFDLKRTDEDLFKSYHCLMVW